MNTMTLHELEEKLKRMREQGADDYTHVVISLYRDSGDIAVGNARLERGLGPHGRNQIVITR